MGAIETDLLPCEASAVFPGLMYGLDIEAYHGGPGVSKSGLDDIERSPAIYHALHLDPRRPAPTAKAGQFEGALAHCATLEPDQFGKRYSVHPKMNRNTKAWHAIEEDCPIGVVPIQVDQYETAMRQAESVRALPEVREALRRGRAETSAYWLDPETGELCRCRPDWDHEPNANAAILLDLKTCGDASPADFARQIARKRYHVQDAFYTDGFAMASGREVMAFIFVAVETQWPYAASAVMLDDESRAAGRAAYRRNLTTYSACRKANHWPGFSSAIEIVNLPAWAMKEAA